MTLLKIGEYEHFRGKHYRVLGVAKHSETMEDLVVYESLYDNTLSKLWTRPLAMFREEVEFQGKRVPRFRHVGK